LKLTEIQYNNVTLYRDNNRPVLYNCILSCTKLLSSFYLTFVKCQIHNYFSLSVHIFLSVQVYIVVFTATRNRSYWT